MALLIALATPAAALGEPSEAADHDIEAILDRMTLEEKIGQMMISSFRVWKELPDPNDANATVENADQEIPAVNVTELNDAIRAEPTAEKTDRSGEEPAPEEKTIQEEN